MRKSTSQFVKAQTLGSSAKVAELLRDLSISARQWKESVALASLYGEFLQCNLVDRFQDYELQEKIYLKVPYFDQSKSISGNIHYITEAYATGGHTQLFFNYILAQIENGSKPCIIVRKYSTVLDRLSEAGVAIHHIEEFEDLLSYSLSGSLYLHAHPWDIEACIVADRAFKSGRCLLFFINHADHCFHFRTNSAVTYLEVSGLGRSISNQYRGISKQSFLGIPINIPPARWKPSQEKFLLTIARREKLRPRDGLDFPKIADSITRKHNINFIIVGQTGQEPWWSEYLSNKHFEFRGVTGAEETLNLLTGCSAYIDSFPFTGGTVLALAGTLGVPIFSLKSVAFGYNAAEIIRNRSIVEMLADLDNYLLNGRLHYKLDEISDHIQRSHSITAFRERISEIENGMVSPFPYWASLSNVGLEEVRTELFSSVRFPIEISSAISLPNRFRIIESILRLKPKLEEVSLQNILISLIGSGGQIHRTFRKIKSILIGFSAR